ncbi:polyhydroxyalkanoate synthesis repressor PhaR [Parasphingopyxis marina]|uniref:Polyhydroxyalkanoate synthesis repressor PhaR n=1 Tax=Parasphingopyxis marina TaxID=2761622 RepID=A0A842HYD9_9SPHN|nr:polyhydroxyalkanoate synthesis repressor PhaR [Parasphingopyxis marina]MBC2777349.1 polyhydroxyalkanoate synthesis repressor PhaR [Parasphingopyxis marina]
MAKSGSDSETVIIKKYANRRLYNTESSSYITLDHLGGMIREKRDFQVIDAKSGDDITHNVLTQIIMEEESHGQNMLPVSFLRQLIGMYGNSMSAMVPQYLEASMEAFQRNQAKFRDAMEGAFGSGPFGEIARRNMEMFEAAAGAFQADAKGETASEPAEAGRDTEVEALKQQLAQLQDQIDKLNK